MLLLVGRVLGQAHAHEHAINVERPLVTGANRAHPCISTRTHQRRATCHRAACEQQCGYRNCLKRRFRRLGVGLVFDSVMFITCGVDTDRPQPCVMNTCTTAVAATLAR